MKIQQPKTHKENQMPIVCDSKLNSNKTLTILILLNIFLTSAVLIILYIAFLSSIKRQNFEVSRAINNVERAINYDMALLRALIDFNAEKGNKIFTTTIHKAALKILTPSQIFIEDSKKQDALLGLSLSKNNDEFVIYRNVEIGSKKQKIAAKFFVPNIKKNFKLLCGHHQVDFINTLLDKNSIEIFRGSNFILTIKKPNVRFFYFLFHDAKIYLYIFSLLLVAFNSLFYFVLKLERKRILNGFKDQTCLLEKNLHDISRYSRLNNDLIKSLNALEIEFCNVMSYFNKQFRNITSHIQAIESTNNYAALSQVCDFFSEIESLNYIDFTDKKDIDCMQIIERAVNIHAHLLQKFEISLIITRLSNESLWCNESIILKIITSILYRAIIASTQKSKINITVTGKDFSTIITIKDYGYTTSFEECASSPFKLSFNEIKSIISRCGMRCEVVEGKGRGKEFSLYILQKNVSDNVVYFQAQ